MKKHPSPKISEPVVPADVDVQSVETKESLAVHQEKGRLTKFAQVDEQIFQEGLAVQLDNERWQNGGDNKQLAPKRSKKTAAKQVGQVSDAILEEFQSMIDDMLPTAKQEQLACMQKVKKEKVVASKTKQKKRGDKRNVKKGRLDKSSKKKRRG